MARQAEEDLGFAVPGQEEEAERISRPVEEHTDKEGNMSLFWLLSHYNKEHAAAYKEQRERKKAEQNGKKHSVRKRKQKAARQDHPIYPSLDSTQPESAAKAESGADERESHFGKTVYVDRKQRPGLCAEQETPQAVLECIGFAQTVPLLQFPFLIGRSSQGVNLCIADNKKVGRRHAVILYRDGQYYIRDLTSLNHVYVDDEQIPPEKDIRLHDQAKLVLGNEPFIFHLNKREREIRI